MNAETLWSHLPWDSFEQFQGGIPTDLREFVETFIKGDLEEREDARDLFRVWPGDSLSDVGQLGAIPLFLQVLCAIIAEDREDVALDIDLLTGLIRRLPWYAKATDWYEGTESEFRASVLNAVRNVDQLLSARLHDDRPRVREAAIGAFMLWRQVEELKGSCTREVVASIIRIVESDDDPSCVARGIEFVVANGDVDDRLQRQFHQHFKSEKVLESLAAAWAICKVDGLTRNPDCINMICKYSLLLTFTIPSIRDLVARLNHVTKCEAACSAADYRRNLAPGSTIRLVYVLMEAVDAFEEREWYHAYCLMLESFRQVPPESDPDKVKAMENVLIRKIVGDDRLWEPDIQPRWSNRLRYFDFPESRDELRRSVE